MKRQGKKVALQYLVWQHAQPFLHALKDDGINSKIDFDDAKLITGSRSIDEERRYPIDDMLEVSDVRDTHPKTTCRFQQNCRFITEAFDLPRSHAPFIELMVLKDMNSGLENVISEAVDVSPTLSWLEVACDCLGLANSDVFRTLVVLAKFDFIRVYMTDNVDVSYHFINLLVTRDLSCKEQLVDDLLTLSAPAQFKLHQFPHVDTDLLGHYLKAATKEGMPGVNVLLYGDAGNGKTELARSLAGHTKRTLYEIGTPPDDFDSVSGNRYDYSASEHRIHYLNLVQKALADSTDSMLLIDECEALFFDADWRYNKEMLASVLEHNRIPCIWITNHVHALEASFLRRFKLVFEVKPLDTAALVKTTKPYFKGLRVSKDFKEKILQTRNITPALVGNATHVAKTINVTGKQAEQTVHTVVRQTLEAGDLLERDNGYQGELAFDESLLNLSSSEEELTQVRHAVEHGHNVRVLLTGPPGTGKTAYAHHIADTLDKDIRRINCSDILSKYVGESEQNIARIFAEATDNETLLLIDEVDSLLSNRAAARAQHEIQLVNELLAQMECFTQPLFAATNYADNLDKAVLRRFDFKLSCNFLTPTQVQVLFKQLLRLDTLSKRETHALQVLTNLTPGDFAIVSRRQRFHPNNNPRQVALDLLIRESKRKQAKSSIGFIH